MNTTDKAVRTHIDHVPELATSVALSAGREQQEVGGAVCLGLAGVAIYFMV